MSSALGIQVDQLRRHMGLTQAELADLVGVSSVTIWKICNGQVRRTRHLADLARVLGTTAEFLDGMNDDPGPRGAAHGEAVALEVFVATMPFEGLLPLAQGAQLPKSGGVTRSRFPAAWVRAFSEAHPDQLAFVHRVGDAMTPTIHDQDRVLIDTSQRVPVVADQIWVVACNGLLAIRRLRPLPGGMQLVADNPAIEAREVTAGEVEVLGRIVAVTRRT